MSDLNYKRFPTVEKKISEITPENVRVSIIGTVVDKTNDKLIVDDGTGSIEIFSDENLIKNVENSKVVRVIGRVTSDGSISINAEIIQDFSKFDIGLYEKIKNI